MRKESRRRARYDTKEPRNELESIGSNVYTDIIMGCEATTTFLVKGKREQLDVFLLLNEVLEMLIRSYSCLCFSGIVRAQDLHKCGVRAKAHGTLKAAVAMYFHPERNHTERPGFIMLVYPTLFKDSLTMLRHHRFYAQSLTLMKQMQKRFCTLRLLPNTSLTQKFWSRTTQRTTLGLNGCA